MSEFHQRLPAPPPLQRFHRLLGFGCKGFDSGVGSGFSVEGSCRVYVGFRVQVVGFQRALRHQGLPAPPSLERFLLSLQCEGYRRTSLIRNGPTPPTVRRTVLGRGLLQGPSRGQSLMSEVPLYFLRVTDGCWSRQRLPLVVAVSESSVI